MFDYRINIDKKVLRLLGVQLYGDTPSIIAELVQNSYDADAKAVWITINTSDPPSIIVQDNGIGMTPNEINSRFLNIGQDRRIQYPISPSGRKVLGRKGIGKLAVFSLAKIVDVYSIKDKQKAACRLDFDDITLHNGNPEDLSDSFVLESEYLSAQNSGTKIVLKNIQKDISKSLNYVINRLVRTFDVNSEDFEIYVRKNDDEYQLLSRADLNFFDYMDTIITFGKDFSSKIIDVKNNSISDRYKYTNTYEDLANERNLQIMPYQISVLDKNGQSVNRNFSFSGWIGTIHERPSFKQFVGNNYSEEGKSKFEVSITDNRITVFSRGKIGEFDILPKTQTNRIADAYVIGEIHADIFEEDDLADMAISNRRGYDETDQRYVNMIKIVSDVVSFITRRKEDINKKKKQDTERIQAENIKSEFTTKSPKTQKVINEKFSDTEKQDFEDELFQFGRALNLSKGTKKIFISHKSECVEYGKFLIRCFDLIGVNVEEYIIFTSVPELGVPMDQDIYTYLKDCFRDDLYVIFLFSRSFYNSNVCIAETGAAWATNKKYSNVVLDMGFSGIDKPINNSQIGVSLNNIQDENLPYNLHNLIVNSLSATNYYPLPDDNIIYNAIDRAISEYKDKLKMPQYIPYRKYLSVPICPSCGSTMSLQYGDNGALLYRCLSRRCTNTIEATIES